ncbi:hypothetical protein N3K66_002929 [Trichothecium roseum]|uniref:Uncharacterized protein n=1 Tax=Trichothecium roseum TaxID=47278 RepID=A0ACC0V5R6_9HYPO|nr:hypothetical protein N3K66_002929 [Trichothecium roseum]
MLRSHLDDMVEEIVRRRAQAPAPTSSEPGRPSDVMHDSVPNAPTSSSSIISSHGEHVTAATTAASAQPTEPKTTEMREVPGTLPTDSQDKSEPATGLQRQGRRETQQRRPRKKMNMPPNVVADRQRIKDVLLSPNHGQSHQQQHHQQDHLPPQSSFAEWSRHWGPQRAFKVPPHGHCLDEQHARHHHDHLPAGLGPGSVVIACVLLLCFLVGRCIPWLTEHGRRRRRRGAVRLREDVELLDVEAGESSRTPLMTPGSDFDETELEEFAI